MSQELQESIAMFVIGGLFLASVVVYGMVVAVDIKLRSVKRARRDLKRWKK